MAERATSATPIPVWSIMAPRHNTPENPLCGDEGATWPDMGWAAPREEHAEGQWHLVRGFQGPPRPRPWPGPRLCHRRDGSIGGLPLRQRPAWARNSAVGTRRA